MTGPQLEAVGDGKFFPLPPSSLSTLPETMEIPPGHTAASPNALPATKALLPALSLCAPGSNSSLVG